MSRRNGGIIGPTNTPVGGLFKGVAVGVWRMNDVLTFVSNSQWPSGPQNIDNSCRFDDGSSDSLSRTPSSSGNRKTWTWSGWIKKSTIGSGYQFVFASTDASTSTGSIGTNYNGDDKIYFRDDLISLNLTPNAVFRDTSAWYHVVVALDTTQSTASDRAKMYINGTQVTSFSTANYPNQDTEGSINLVSGSYVHRIGSYNGSSNFFDGYLAEVVFIDGQALDPTSFGETDSTTGIWKPKKIGSFASAGDNSFYLDFKDSSNVGNDASGLNNDFTVNNLTSIDQSTDTCVENFATLNPLDSGTITFSDGNLTATAGSDYQATKGTIAVNAGKWYFEAKINAPGGGSAVDNFIGITGDNTAVTGTTYDNNPSVLYSGSGTVEKDGTTVQSSLTTFSTGTIVGVALNMDDSEIEFYINGSKQGSTQSISSFTGFYLPFYIGANTRSASFNFGAPPYSISSGNADANGFGNFEYSVPSGYYALNTTNLNTYG